MKKNKISKRIFKSDFKLGNKIPLNFGFFSFSQRDEENIPTNSNDNITNENKETEVTKETEQSLYVKTIDSKIRNNNLSFISKIFDEGKSNKKNLMRKIKHMKYIKNNFLKEKQLLKGFETEERKDPLLLIKNLKPKLKTNGELFDEDLNILRKTNPIAFQLQQKKDEFDMKQSIKKVNMLKVNEKNIMKRKNLIITEKKK